MATQYVCDRCKKPIEPCKFHASITPYKYVFGLERAAGYHKYDLCVGCMLEVQKCLDGAEVKTDA